MPFPKFEKLFLLCTYFFPFGGSTLLSNFSRVFGLLRGVERIDLDAGHGKHFEAPPKFSLKSFESGGNGNKVAIFELKYEKSH